VLREKLKPVLEDLVCKEIQLLHLEQIGTPAVVVEEITVSIRELKREIVRTTESLEQRKRAALIKRIIREAMDEEIERTIRQRGNPCLRCVHMRYYDATLTSHEAFPVGTERARILGCDQISPVSRHRCERFQETRSPVSVLDYVDEMNLLYEVREMFRKMRALWGNYLNE
jgi:hypothetical protein